MKRVAVFFAVVALFLAAGCTLKEDNTTTAGKKTPTPITQDADDSNTGDADTDTETDTDNLIVNTKYGFSLDLGESAANISEMSDQGDSDSLDTYIYCYKLLEGDTDLGGDDECGEGSVSIFIIQVLDEDQFADAGEIWGELLGTQDSKYFVYTHLNGMMPENLPVGFLDSVPDHFAFDQTTTDDSSDTSDQSVLSASAQVLSDLKDESTIGFSGIRSTEFDWMVPSQGDSIQSVSVDGYLITAEAISFTDDDIDDFFIYENFEMDQWNAADGTLAGLEGYKKGDIVCHILRTYSGSEEELDMGDAQYFDAEVRCGELPV